MRRRKSTLALAEPIHATCPAAVYLLVSDVATVTFSLRCVTDAR